MKDPLTLDFHKFSVGEMRAAIRVYFYGLLNEKISTDKDHLMVIVGKGIHSAGEPKLRDACLTQLNDEFEPSLKAFQCPQNAGVVVVKVMLDSLRAWLEDENRRCT